MSTCKQIADVLGLSPSTVSRALSGNRRISATTRELVEKTAAKMNYVPHLAASSLRTEHSRTLGVLVPDVALSYWPSIIKGIEAKANECGYSILLGVSHTDMAGEQKLRPHVMSFLRHRADGIIKLAHLGDYEEELRSMMWERDTVLIDVDRPGYDAVPGRTHIGFENKEGAFQATRHLVELGHARIAHISGALELYRSARDRYEGFRDAVKAGGLSIPEAYRAECPSYTFQEGLVAAESLLTLPERPTAIVACSDYVAFAVLQVAHRLGISVPDDLSVVGFDDTGAASQLPVPLSTVRVPAQKAGEMAFDMFLERREHPRTLPMKVVLPTELVKRASCSTPALRDAGGSG